MKSTPEIILKGAPNARDLGGIETADGRLIRKNRLIRSGGLGKLYPEDVEYLKNAGLRTVVDFRTEPERMEKPDIILDGVDYIVCPLLERKTEGITRLVPETEEEEALRTVSMAHRLMAHGPDGRKQMRSLYPILVSNPFCIEHFRQFFDILLGHNEGALLYHCTMGKDRVGTATALLLSALGVPRESIIADYLITAERCAPGTERLIKNCRKICGDEEVLQFIYYLDTVEESFIKAAFDTVKQSCGSVENFLREKIGLDAEKIAKLKNLYLE